MKVVGSETPYRMGLDPSVPAAGPGAGGLLHSPALRRLVKGLQMLDGLKKFLRQNVAGLSLMVAAVVVFIGMLMAGGCSWGDLLTAQVPNEVRQMVNAPPKATLNEAEVYLGAYRDSIKLEYDKRVAAGQLLADRISRGWEVAGFFTAATNLGFAALQGSSLAGLPGGALGLSLLTGLGGLLMKGPGTGKEKEKSYRKGQDDFAKLFLALNPNAKVPELPATPST